MPATATQRDRKADQRQDGELEDKRWVPCNEDALYAVVGAAADAKTNISEVFA